MQLRVRYTFDIDICFVIGTIDDQNFFYHVMFSDKSTFKNNNDWINIIIIINRMLTHIGIDK